MEGPARAGHDPGGGLRLEWPDFRQPVPDRQGDDGDQLERPSLLRASAGKSRRCGSEKGPPKGRGQRRRENRAWRIARKLAPVKNLTSKRGLRCAIYTRVSTVHREKARLFARQCDSAVPRARGLRARFSRVELQEQVARLDRLASLRSSLRSKKRLAFGSKE